MKGKRNMRKLAKRIMSVVLGAAMLVSLLPAANMNVCAASESVFNNEAADKLVASILGDGITATNVQCTGSVRGFSGGMSEIGIESGIALDTSNNGVTNIDPDLLELIKSNGNSYGDGHVSTIQFDLIATGSLLNFNYAFASCEFDQPAAYNDIFGLFVSVNDSKFENIAILDDGKSVTIQNLKEGNYYTSWSGQKLSFISSNSHGSGVSNIFTAQKKVNKGDKVTVKFAISDVGDDALDSYVFIQAGSLSFDAPGAKPNYTNETLGELTPNATYVVSSAGETYTFVADENGQIPLSGTDQNGKNYDFIGKQISIYQKGEGDTGDSEAKDVEIAARPNPSEPEVPTDTPADIDKENVTTTNNSITINAVPGQEYRIGEDGEWISADDAGKVVFNGLEGLKDYTIYTRVKATDGAPASLVSEGVKVTTKGMFDEQSITKTENNGVYDGTEHVLKVETSIEGATITYSDTLNGTYRETPYSFKNSGTHTVYYCISKDGYYKKYGTLTIEIQHDKHILEYSAEDNRLVAKCTDENCEYHEKGVSLTLSADSKVYSGDDVKASYGVGEAEEWKNVTGTEAPTIQYEYKATANGTYASTTETKNAGFYKATATCGNQTASIEFEITKKEITDNDVVLDKDSFVVATDGTTVQAPAVTVTSDGRTLVSDMDYTLSGDTSKVFAGNYMITVSGTGNYTGIVKKTWKIEKNPQTLANMNPTISDANILATQVIVDESVGGAGDVTYAISETNEAPTDGWQSSNVFSGLKPETTYYVFVRCAGDAIYDPATSKGTAFTTKAIANVDVKGITEVEGIADPGITYDGEPVTVAEIIKGTPSVTETPFDVTYTYIDAESGKELSSAPADAGSYKLIVTVKSANTTATKEIAFKIKDAEQSTVEAETIAVEPTTIYGKSDGKITGLSPEYEYSTDGGNTYTTCEGNELSGVSGTVKIRRKAKPNYAASEPIDVVIPEGKKIKLQVPDIKNCTITASPSEVAYNESATITIKPDSGYKLTEPLTAVIGGVERTFVKDSDGNYTCTISEIKGMDALKVTGTTGVVEKSYEDVTPATGSVNDITGSKDAVAETNTFAAEIKNPSELEKLLDVTAQEKAQGVNIWLKVVDASSTAPKADKDVIDNEKNDFVVGMLLDISLYKKVGNQEAIRISNTNGMTKISVRIPENLRKKGRMY